MSSFARSPLLECSKLTVVTPRVKIEDISVKVYDGDWVEVVGAPGSGKSILFQIFSLRHFDREGEIYIKNKSLRHMPAHEVAEFRRRMASCAQRPLFLEHYTVKQNLSLPLIARKKRGLEIEEQLDLITEEFRIHSILETQMKYLSQQERLFVGVVRAFIGEPALILVDAVFESLAEPYRERIIRAMKERHKDGVAFVLFCCDKTGLCPEAKLVRLKSPILDEDAY